MSAVAAGPVTLESRLEFHRRGVGLLRESAKGERGHAAFVSRGADDDESLRTCSCTSGRAKRRACAHLLELNHAVDGCHERWAGRSWDHRFRGTLWYGLAERLFVADRRPCPRVRVAIGRAGWSVEGADGALLLRSPSLSASTSRLLDRCGVAPGIAPASSRARLIEHLQLLQLTPHERALHDAGMPTHQHAFESSLWYRVAYHCAREYDDDGSFHPAVDLESGHFLIRYAPPGSEPPLHLALPRPAVEETLAYLAARFPGQADLKVRPIPLASIFRIGATTELDLDVRPQVRLLQEDGQARYLERDELERFRYGRLVYVRELGVLAELELPGRERRFLTPTRMQLRASQIPHFLEDLSAAGAEAPTLLDHEDREVRILQAPDSVEVFPLEQDGTAYWSRVSYRFGEATVSLADVFRARTDGLPFLPTSSGWIDVGAPCFSSLDGLSAAAERDAVRDHEVRLTSHDLLRLRAFSEAPVGVAADAPGAALLDKTLALRPSGEYPLPAGLASPLRAYQAIGLDWLLFLFENGLSGLLCDEMGLGKTHQALALLLTIAEQGLSTDPFLVVCPTSVVSHWSAKIRTHTSGLTLHVYHGSDRERPEPGPGQVWLTSYGVLRNDVERLKGVPFAVAVFDEMQQLKNAGTFAHQAAAAIPARMRLGLTGTPIENNVGELRALVDLVLPGYLGSERQFTERFGAPTMREADPRHARLRRVLSPFLLRRLKTAVLDELPAKTEDIRTCRLSDEQARLYQDVLAAKAGPLVDALKRRDRPVPYIHVFALLNVLKQICDHPALVHRRPADHAAHASGKWAAFVEILDEALAGGQKVIVFTQYLGMIDIFDVALQARGVGFATLTGSTRDRGAVIERFDTDPDCRVFLASLKAAGQGIDLVAGSVVVHYDRWWNAAREDQATDRAHRIGQKRAVSVFKLVTEGTLEEKISVLIDSKRRLLSSIVEADEPGLAKTFSRDELLALLGPLIDGASHTGVRQRS